MTSQYYYYEAVMNTGKKIHLFARDDIEAAYRAAHIAKHHWHTSLKDIYLDKHHHYNEERISKQLQYDKELPSWVVRAYRVCYFHALEDRRLGDANRVSLYDPCT